LSAPLENELWKPEIPMVCGALGDRDSGMRALTGNMPNGSRHAVMLLATVDPVGL
jgi:hypothetical protein